jgi:hypothetical protein
VKKVVLISEALPSRSACVEAVAQRLGYRIVNALKTLPVHETGGLGKGQTQLRRRSRVEQRIESLASSALVVGGVGAFGSAHWRLFTHGILWSGARYEQLSTATLAGGESREYLEDRLRRIEKDLETQTMSLLSGAALLRLSQRDSDAYCVEAIVRFLQ